MMMKNKIKTWMEEERKKKKKEKKSSLDLTSRQLHWVTSGQKKKAYFELKRISSIRRFLTEDATKTLVTSYILSLIHISEPTRPP